MSYKSDRLLLSSLQDTLWEIEFAELKLNHEIRVRYIYSIFGKSRSSVEITKLRAKVCKLIDIYNKLKLQLETL